MKTTFDFRSFFNDDWLVVGRTVLERFGKERVWLLGLNWIETGFIFCSSSGSKMREARFGNCLIRLNLDELTLGLSWVLDSSIIIINAYIGYIDLSTR